MKKKNTSAFTLFLVMLFMSCFVSAQIKIGTNPTQIVAGSKLQIDGDNKATTPAKLIVTGNGNVGVGTAAPDASALLDISTTDKGVLIPRVSLTATNVAAPILSPATSLLVYNTATAGTAPDKVSPGYYYWDGAKWVQLATTVPNSNWNLLGNAGTNAGTNFIGTTDNIDFVTRTNNAERMRVTTTGNVGIGTTTPNSLLDLGATVGTSVTDVLGKKLALYNNAAGNDFYGIGVNSGALQFHASSTAAEAPGMVLTAGGNVGVGTATPDASALLDLGATDKGMLIPRVSLTATNVAAPITSPAASLMVYNTATAGTAPDNVSPGYYYWDSAKWVQLLTSSTPSTSWNLLGNAGTNASTNFVGTTDNIDFVTRTNNTEKMRITATGNVGIGTTTPNAPLQFGNTLGNRKMVLYELANNDDQFFGLGINGNTFRYQTAATTADHVFYAGKDATASTELMRITGTGKVGIGTATPGQTLSVSDPNTGTVVTTSILQPNLGIGNGNYLKFGKALSTNDAADIAFNYAGPGSANNNLSLGFNGNPATNMFLTATGNVGVGTATPEGRLSILGYPGGITDLMQIGLSNCGSYCSQPTGRSLVFYNQNGNGEFFGSLSFVSSADPNQPEGSSIVAIDRNATNNSAGLDFKTRNITTNVMDSRLTIRSDGKVGVGTASPTSLLSVNGGADKTDGPNWAVFSDKRLKKDIHPFTDGLQQVLQIKPVFFKYNGKGGIDPSKKEQIGIIAQEMQQIAPYAITETERKIDDSGKGALQFNHSEAVTYMLVNAVKEQQSQIEKQKTENSELKKQLAAQQETLSSLLKEVASLKESISAKK